MNQDKTYVFQHSIRIAKCMRECFIHRKDAGSVVSIMTLERCLHAHSWHDSSTTLRQLRGIGVSFVRKLAMKGVNTFERLSQTEPEELEMWLSRSTPFGRDVLNDLERIPKYELNVVKESHVRSPDFARLTKSGRRPISKGSSCHILRKACSAKCED